MLNNDFTAAMTSEELLSGEARHTDTERSRKQAMAAGLTRSSEELQRAWQKDSSLYLTTLSGAIAAYEENRNIEEMLTSCIARLVSVIDEDGEVVERALEVVKADTAEEAS
jgi:peroxiredoxin